MRDFYDVSIAKIVEFVVARDVKDHMNKGVVINGCMNMLPYCDDFTKSIEKIIYNNASCSLYEPWWMRETCKWINIYGPKHPIKNALLYFEKGRYYPLFTSFDGVREQVYAMNGKDDLCIFCFELERMKHCISNGNYPLYYIVPKNDAEAHRLSTVCDNQEKIKDMLEVRSMLGLFNHKKKRIWRIRSII